MSTRQEQVEQCAYCGAVENLDKDHVPPKGIFPKPRPSNLITVPACPKCHSRQTSKDDEYFRLALNVRDELSQHSAVRKIQPVIMRSLFAPNKIGMLRAFLNSICVAESVTPGGIFIKNQLAIQTDMNRVRGVVQRTMKGLFYHHNKYRVPNNYDALVCDENSFQTWPAEQ